MGIFGFFNKNKKETLDKGLEKTKTSVFDKIARVVAGKSKVDDDVLDDLEEVLITSDVGVDTTLKIIRRIEERVARDKYVSTSELNGILRDEIASLLAENNSADNAEWDLPADHKPYVILVVGVNGVGKTTTGKALAEKTGKRFLDLDQVITQHQERTPEEIIRSDGVDRFRRIENEVLKALVRGARTGGLVLACGGGVVEREENRQLLRENGRVIWLCRDISELPTEGRPVSQTGGLERLLERRRPAYESWSDFAVLAVGPQPTALRIIEEIKKRSQGRENE